MRLIILFVVFIIQKSAASNLCNEENCVQKCCPENNYILLGICTLYTENIEFNNISVYNNSKEFELVGHFDDFFKIKAGAYLDPKFREHLHNQRVKYNAHYLLKNGNMVLKTKSTSEFHEFTPQQYCIDRTMSKDNKLVEKPVVWFKNKNTGVDTGNHVILKWGFLVSSVFLLLVLVVYSLLPELRNLGGLILMAYVASLMLGFVFLFTIQVGTRDFEFITCLIITCLTYYFLLASFCWLNVMSYDIWWTFRGYAKARPINRRGENVKFLIYCIYAFCTPLGMTIALATLNQINLKHRLAGIVPQIPLKGCFIEGPAKYVYLYAPMMIMIVANWIFFAMTAFNIWRLSRGSDVLRSADSGSSGSASARHNNKQRLVVYLKLSVIMGLSWILEVVSTLYPDFKGWFITDCYNVFIGVVIFGIFVCKRKILNKLKKRYTNFKHTHKSSFQAKSQSRSRSSQDESLQTQSIPLQSSNGSISLSK